MWDNVGFGIRSRLQYVGQRWFWDPFAIASAAFRLLLRARNHFCQSLDLLFVSLAFYWSSINHSGIS
jgi:hypothetical protein